MQTSLNKQLILSYHDLVFNQHQPELAATQFIADHYLQHNPKAWEGRAGFINFFKQFFLTYPYFRVEIKHCAAESDLVFLHVHAKRDELDLGDAVVDIYRLSHGKICEHWDVIQKIEANSQNPISYF